MEMKTHKIRDTIFLFLTAMIWGAAFVAQSVSMDYIGPFTFICLRSVIGGLFLIPVIMVIDNIRKKRRSESVKTASDNGINSFQKMQAEEEKLSWKNKRLLESGIVCGIFLFLANCFQQTGIQYTTVGKAGFITTFYIIIVPVVGLFFKKYCGILTWIGVVIALAGLYFLCITEKMTIQRGDALILCCSFLYTGQILAIDHYSRIYCFAGVVPPISSITISISLSSIISECGLQRRTQLYSRRMECQKRKRTTGNPDELPHCLFGRKGRDARSAVPPRARGV